MAPSTPRHSMYRRRTVGKVRGCIAVRSCNPALMHADEAEHEARAFTAAYHRG